MRSVDKVPTSTKGREQDDCAKRGGWRKKPSSFRSVHGRQMLKLKEA